MLALQGHPRHVDRLKEVQAAGGCPVGAKPDANPAAPHLWHFGGTNDEVAERAVGDTDPSLGVKIDLVCRKQDRVCGVRPGPEETDPVEVLGGALPPVFGGIVDLVGPLREVDVHAGSGLVGQVSEGVPKFTAAHQQLAQRQPRTYALFGCRHSPGLYQRNVSVDRLPGREPHRRRQPFAHVHGGLGNQATDPHVQRRAGHLVGVRAARVGETGRPDPQHVRVSDLA